MHIDFTYKNTEPTSSMQYVKSKEGTLIFICPEAQKALGVSKDKPFTIRAIPCDESRAKTFPVYVYLQYESIWWSLFGPVEFCMCDVQASITNLNDDSVRKLLGYLPEKDQTRWFRIEVVKCS